MAGTRYTATSKTRLNVPGLRSGYDNQNVATDITIPSVGVEDVDEALFNLFDKEINYQVVRSKENREEIARVPIIFSASEKWALAKKKNGFRDRNGSLILPLITIVRTTIQQSVDDITGRGINQQTGELVIKRRLDKSDRSYQNLINKHMIRNQSNVATNEDNDGFSTGRTVGSLIEDPIVSMGGLLAGNVRKNVYEFLTLPSPQFFTAMYEVTMWAQYTIQMVQMVEQTMASFLPQGNAWKLDTKKGYWFIATIDGNVFNAENNLENMSTDERMIKYKFTVKVPGYVLATGVPGAPVPVRRYVSSPDINFDVGLGPGAELTEVGGIDEPFLGSDDPTLPMDQERSKRADQRFVNDTRLYPKTNDEANVDDPALLGPPRKRILPKYRKISIRDSSGRLVTRVVRVTTTSSQFGESTLSGANLGELSIVVTDD